MHNTAGIDSVVFVFIARIMCRYDPFFLFHVVLSNVIELMYLTSVSYDNCKELKCTQLLYYVCLIDSYLNTYFESVSVVN